MTDKERIKELEKRVQRLEDFLTSTFDWDQMLDESNLEETILDTVNCNFYVSVNAELRKNG
jgi:hypothetical protein